MKATATRPGGRHAMHERTPVEMPVSRETPSPAESTAPLWTFLSPRSLEALLRFVGVQERAA